MPRALPATSQRPLREPEAREPEAREPEPSGVVPRATGTAVGRNPVSILVPCHRVIGANGSLTGYAGGLARKERLLQHEGVLLT